MRYTVIFRTDTMPNIAYRVDANDPGEALEKARDQAKYYSHGDVKPVEILSQRGERFRLDDVDSDV